MSPVFFVVPTTVKDMIRVGVVGAAGKMGSTVCDAVAAAEGMELVAAVDTQNSGAVVHGITIANDLKALADAKCEVVVDFTVADAARTTLPWLALHGMHAVVGTTGFSDADLASFQKAFTGLLARAVVVADEKGNVLHTELVSDIANEPNYDAAINSLK